MLIAPLAAAAHAGAGVVVHELTTNAISHGALAKAKGRINVMWKIEKGRLVVAWRERGGGKVAKPSRRGLEPN
jgi:two-component sensor histidine kinase